MGRKFVGDTKVSVDRASGYATYRGVIRDADTGEAVGKTMPRTNEENAQQDADRRAASMNS